MAKLSDKRNYEYVCKGCGETQEIRRTVEERDNTVTCNNCNTDMMRKFSLSHFTI